jgi:hypothetical protein
METLLTSDADILAKIEAFRVKWDMAPSTFGRLAVGDGNLVADLNEGKRSLTLRTARRVLEFMATYRPDTAPELAKVG